MWKKVDERIRTLIENGVKQRHRSIFLIVGDKSRDQIVNLNHILSKALVKAKPTTLWCYKDRLEISSHRKKRAKNIKTLMRTGLLDPEKADPFSLFVESGGITYCLYKDSERILGNTFSMCILQDFEALTPNLLARTIETVEGGGLILLLLRSLSSLTSLCTMVMDVHQRFRTESHSEAAGRFNERFLLSLASCKACVVMDDEFNILPISSHIRSIKPVPTKEDSEGLSEVERDLKILKEQLNEEFPVGPLIKKCCTLDQGKAVITFLDAILDKTLQSTVALLAARGRGKSAALGLAVSGAVAAGYSNIYITAPSPENLKTLFEFVLKGFDSLEYKEHTDYDVVKCSNTEYNMGKQSSSRGSNQVIVRINIYKQHRQTIQYIQPNEGEKLSQVELLVIDEAAAIPLPIVKSLLGPYLVFISSTVNGYEGTGRSLSLKLLHQLEEQSQTSTKGTEGALSGRLFKKIELSESIRYAPGDPIELWLNGLLCLDVANYIPNIHRLPPPEKCDLYYVNRDTLFSYHKDSELFLQRMMALYVASHYKNSPNDLQLMSDAPAHHLFVLLGPVDESKNHLPDILCVVQVCLEGQISHKSAMKSLSEGYQPHGDQIPWKFCEQFRDTEFPSLSGARIVRIATHPSATRLGYGSKAVELLTSYYEGCFTSISEIDEEDVEKPPVSVIEAAQKVSLLEENIKPRSNLPPLLVHLRERRQERLHYVGVSFGLTQDLFRFWRKLEFFPFYISQIPNAVTGEHTCMVLKPLKNEDVEFGDFFTRYYNEFRARFIGLLGPCFSSMHFKLAMSILEPKINFSESEKQDSNLDEVLQFLKNTPHALKLLEAYANGLADFHLIIDLLRPLAGLYFLKKVPVTLQYIQASILLLMGLQHQDVSYTKDQMQLESDQIMSNLKKVMTKLYKFVYSIASKDVESTIPRPKEQIVLKPHSISLDEDLNEAARQVQEQMRGGAEADGISEKKHDDKSAQQEPPSPAISGEAVEKAVKALLKWKDCQPNSEKPQLLSSDDFVYLVVTVKKIPSKSRTNPYKIPLVHPLFSHASDGSELCLFLDDRPDRLPSSKDAKAKIASESIPIPKVIKLSKLETDYKPFEAKRKLCDSYDLFLADRRIIPLLPKHLGKHFFKKKIPVAVDLEHQNWKEQVERICSSALLHLSTGTCSTVRVARSSMAPADIVENVMAAINGVAETVPRKWSNLRSLHLKRSDSVALPIYQSLPEANLNVIGLLEEGTSEEGSVDVASLGKKRGREGEDLLSSKKSPKASSKKGRIHQVRYMDDAIDKAAAAAEENVVKVKKAKKKEASSKVELVEG